METTIPQMDFNIMAFIVPFMVLGFINLGVTLWALLDCAMNEPSQGNDKIVWIIIILVTGLLGSVLYFMFRRPKRKRELSI
jgi:phospholipase D-like protein